MVSDVNKLNFVPYSTGKDEEYMNEDQLTHLQQLLLQWKDDLMQEANKTKTHMQDGVVHFPDPNDRASQEEEISLELRTRDRERKLIQKIDQALKQIGNKEYGYCATCGSEIGVRRLEVRLTATQCIGCKTLDEIREKRHS